MQSIQSVAQFMGGAAVLGAPQSEFDFVEIIRAGLPSNAIKSVVLSSEISEEELCRSLRIAKRTVARRKVGSARLKASESELLYRFSRVLVAAREVMGDNQKAKNWLLAENRALHSQRPIDLLDTGIGFEDVMDVLRRIEFGVYS